MFVVWMAFCCKSVNRSRPLQLIRLTIPFRWKVPATLHCYAISYSIVQKSVVNLRRQNRNCQSALKYPQSRLYFSPVLSLCSIIILWQLPVKKTSCSTITACCLRFSNKEYSAVNGILWLPFFLLQQVAYVCEGPKVTFFLPNLWSCQQMGCIFLHSTVN